MVSDSALVKFGKHVRTLRNKAGVSQEALASQARMHRTYLSGIERGERNVSLINIVKLAKALNVPPSELVGGID
ncbi:MAG: helix-turn-helix transcriptional regulator [Rubrobacter sp.]|nr:helix-turn-helix transcriptional regulator [Rubrobacter sp.]